MDGSAGPLKSPLPLLPRNIAERQGSAFWLDVENFLAFGANEELKLYLKEKGNFKNPGSPKAD